MKVPSLDALSIVLVHNYYQQPGGEDHAFRAEAAMLESRGHHVSRFTLHNDAVRHMHPLALAAGTVWRPSVARELRALFRRVRPDLAHFHNTFPLVSPAAYYAAARAGIPVVQTLHNYRLLCVNALLFRDGGVCEDCLGKAVPWPGVRHACYRHSRAASGVTAAMLTMHRGLGTWKRRVDRYIAETGFARDRFVAGGLPAEKIAVKPNFVVDPGAVQPGTARRGALFVGRLSEEKGLATLVAAWRNLDLPLELVGGGPLAEWLRREAPSSIRLLGAQDRDAVTAAMRRAAVLVVPSVWYETFGIVLVEAFANALPVIASRLGAMAELVDEGETGLLFAPGDPEDLAAKLRWAQEHPDAMRRMGARARRVYEQNYTPEVNYRQLMSIYDEAVEESRSH